MEHLMSTGQVARRLEVSESRVVQLARAGLLRHERTALGRLFFPEDVERYAKERAAKKRLAASV